MIATSTVNFPHFLPSSLKKKILNKTKSRRGKNQEIQIDAET